MNPIRTFYLRAVISGGYTGPAAFTVPTRIKLVWCQVCGALAATTNADVGIAQLIRGTIDTGTEILTGGPVFATVVVATSLLTSGLSASSTAVFLNLDLVFQRGEIITLYGGSPVGTMVLHAVIGFREF